MIDLRIVLLANTSVLNTSMARLIKNIKNEKAILTASVQKIIMKICDTFDNCRQSFHFQVTGKIHH